MDLDRILKYFNVFLLVLSKNEQFDKHMFDKIEINKIQSESNDS